MERTQVLAIASAVLLHIFVLDLVRRRRLREEYSWLWLVASVIYLLVAAWPPFSRWMGALIGTSNAASAFTFLAFLFIILILIQYSVRLSKLTNQVKDLTQHLAIVDSEQQELSTAREQASGSGLARPAELGTDGHKEN
ncbi:MAG: DUF2304 domain-containing protein [Chloroflexota bacterium]